jgi:phage FluMu gp28-like protein
LHGYRLRVSSTPNGVGNDFHRLWTDEKENAGWSKHQTTLEDAFRDGLVPEEDRAAFLADCWKMAKGDPRLFSQLFKCSFLDGNEQYIPTVLVQAAILQDTFVDESVSVTYAGYDVGLVNDLSCLVIVRQTQDNRVWVQRVDVGKRTDWDLQQENIYQAFQDYGIKRLCIDETGMGVGLVKLLQKRLGTQKVVGVNFNLKSKEELATDAYQAFGDKMIHIPNDYALVKDILSIRRIITTSGNVRYDAPHTDDGHADRAWALFLAIHACTNKPSTRTSLGAGDFENTL